MARDPTVGDTIARWLRHADGDAGRRAGVTTDEQANLARLRRAVALLTKERAVRLLGRVLRVSRSGLYAWRARRSAAERLVLRALDDDAVRALLRPRYALAAPDETRLVAYLQARAEGNSFFAGELVRTLEEVEALRAVEDGGWTLGDLTGAGVPPLLRQVLEGRLGRLGEAAGDLLAVAAVIGQDVPIALWTVVADVTEAALFEAVERAAAAHILTAAEDGTRVRFVHALTREALYEGLLPPRRRGWHRRVAEALLAAPRPDPDTVAAHFQRAGDPRAVAWLLAASERADRAYAWLTAAERAEAALALLEEQGADIAERGWLCLRLARLRRYGDHRHALAYAEQAVALADQSGDRALAAISLYHLGLLHCHDGHLRDGLAALAAGAAAREDLAPEEHARLMGRQATIGAVNPYRGRNSLAVWLVSAGRYAEAAALAERLLATVPVTRETDRTDLRVALGGVAASRGRLAESARWHAEARAHCRAADDHWMVGQVAFLEVLIAHLPYRADHPDARERLGADADAAWGRSGGLASAERTVPLARLPLLVLAGAWDAAWEIAVAARGWRRDCRSMRATSRRPTPGWRRTIAGRSGVARSPARRWGDSAGLIIIGRRATLPPRAGPPRQR